MADENIPAEVTMAAITRLVHERKWATAGSLTPAGRDLLARVEAEGRTPANVLRAMLASYTLADLDARAAWVPERSHDGPLFVSGRRAAYLAGCVKDLMLEAELCARRPDRVPQLGPDGALAADYAARLAGTTPIDAPPAKEPR